jgi:glycine/D-amino acid oxidase-like deaminating enzyme
MEQFDVVVVGGGIAGLAAAATAAAPCSGPGRSVLLVDTTDAGGRAATDEVGRFRFNRGAHALYRTGAGRGVLDRLGVRVTGASPPLKGAQGRLRDQVGMLPLGPTSLVRSPLLGARDKVRAGRLLNGIGKWRPAELADRTAAQWFDELGLTGDARALVEMVARLTSYAADLDLVSADLVAQQVQLGLGGGVDYLHGGWASLVEGLRSAAWDRGVRTETGARVRRVEPEPGSNAERGDDGTRGVRVLLGDGRTIRARRVVLATGTPDAVAALLPGRPASWSGLGPPVRAACLDVGLAEVPDVGVLLGVDRPLYLIRHAPPAELAPPGGAVVHILWYLRHDEDPSPDEAREFMAEHCRVAGFDPDTAEQQRYLHRMVVCGALPTPGRGGVAGRPDVDDTGVEGVLVAGDWVGPEGHLADAALASGERAARRAVADLVPDPAVEAIGAVGGPG